jgi:hypothetical protein
VFVGTIAAQSAAATARVPHTLNFGVVTATPSKNLINGQAITVHASGFEDPDGTTLYVAECAPIIATDHDPADCDQRETSVKTPQTTGGEATALFHVETGSNFQSTKGGLKCDPKNPCYVVVTDGLTAETTSYAGFAPLDFGKVTKTALTGKTSLKAGKTEKLTATVKKGFAATGKVIFKDNGKKIGKVALTDGVAKLAEKHVKKGTHKFTATYKGDSNNKASTGKLKVTVTK